MLPTPPTPQTEALLRVVRLDTPVLVSGDGPTFVRGLATEQVLVLTDADLQDTSLDETLRAGVPTGWTTSGTGSVAGVVGSGVDCIADAVVTSDETYSAFDCRVDIEVRQPGVGAGAGGVVELAALECVVGGVVARVVWLRGVGDGGGAGDVAVGTVDGVPYGGVSMAGLREATLRLVRDDVGRRIWGFVGGVRVLDAGLAAGDASLRFACRNLSTSTRLVSRFTDWRIGSALSIADKLVDGLTVVSRGQATGDLGVEGEAGSGASETAAVALFGPWGRLTTSLVVGTASAQVLASGGAVRWTWQQ